MSFPKPGRALWLASLIGVALLGACGPTADADAEPADASETAVAQAEPLACFLRGATPEEAAARPSPLGETEVTLGENRGKLCYGRPSANDRVVMGELVPFGEPWRVGANEATVLHLAFTADVGGIELEPGSYSLYAVPGETEWEFFINSNAERWGRPIDDEVRGADIGSFTVPSGSTRSMVEQLTVGWHSHGNVEGHLVVDWERTRVEIPVSLGGR
jgi:hypothetical protein